MKKQWSPFWIEVVHPKTEIFWFWVPTIIIYAVSLKASWWLLGNIDLKIAGGKLPLWYLWLAVVALYTRYSYRAVPAPLVGSKTLFGNPIQHVNPGLVFVPLWLFKLKLERGSVVQMEVAPTRKDPQDPEGKKYLPESKKFEVAKDGTIVYKSETQDLHIATAAPSTADYEDFEDDPKKRKIFEEQLKKNTLHLLMTLAPILNVRFKIRHHPTLLRVMGSLQNAIKQIEDQAVSGVSNEFGKWTPAMITRKLDEMDRRLLNSISWEIGDEDAECPAGRKDKEEPESWGLDLLTAGVKYAGLPLRVSQAQADLGASMNNAEGVKIAAAAEQERLTREGAGKASAEEALLDARTISLKKRTAELKITGEQALAAETAKEVTDGPGKTLIVGINSAISEAVGAIAGNLKK